MEHFKVGMVAATILYLVGTSCIRTNETKITKEITKVIEFCNGVKGDFHLERLSSTWEDETTFGCKVSFWEPEGASSDKI